MCGLPYSGKTVLAEELSGRLGFPIVGIDNIREERGFSWEDNEKVTPGEWKSIFEESYMRTMKFLNEGKSVIYDSANLDRESRDRLRLLVKDGNFETKVILVDISEAEVRRRWLKNQSTKERFHLPEKYLQIAVDTYERPTDDENLISYDQTVNKEGWIDHLFLK